MGSGRRCGFAAILRRELIFPFAACQANDFPLDYGKCANDPARIFRLALIGGKVYFAKSH